MRRVQVRRRRVVDDGKSLDVANNASRELRVRRRTNYESFLSDNKRDNERARAVSPFKPRRRFRVIIATKCRRFGRSRVFGGNGNLKTYGSRLYLLWVMHFFHRLLNVGCYEYIMYNRLPNRRSNIYTRAVRLNTFLSYDRIRGARIISCNLC